MSIELKQKCTETEPVNCVTFVMKRKIKHRSDLGSSEQSMFTDVPFDSNPALSAKNSAFLEQIESFSYSKHEVRHLSEPPSKTKLRPPIMAEKHKYKLARLIHHDYDLTKRWYVLFWAWDVSKDKYVRRRLYDPLNRKKNLPERIREADMMIRSINAQLHQGKVLGKKSGRVDKVNVMKLTLLESCDFVYNQKNLNKNRVNYTRGFLTLKTKLEDWLEHEQRVDFPLKQFDLDDTFAFFDFVRDNVGSNKTFNNYRDMFAILINFLMKRNPNLFQTNPIQSVTNLPVHSKRHAAYTDKQLAEINKACVTLGYGYTLFFIQFIYYTLGRPLELRGLRVGNINVDKNRILFPAEISKNKRDEYVGIPNAFKQIIIDSGILSFPVDYFIFGKSKPDNVPCSKLYHYERLVKVLKHLSYDKLLAEHDVYSFKHSGAISLYMATKDIKLVQNQCRHNSVAQTDHYLRDLGLMDDFESLKNWTGNL